MKEIADAIKYVGSVFSAILVCSTFIVTVCKPVRKWFVGKIRDISKSDESDKMLKDISALLKDHIDTDKEWKQKIEEQMESQRETNVIQLRDTLNHTYEKNLETRQISTREKENVVDMYSQYKKIGGNHYVEQIYGEMMNWDSYKDRVS